MSGDLLATTAPAIAEVIGLDLTEEMHVDLIRILAETKTAEEISKWPQLQGMYTREEIWKICEVHHIKRKGAGHNGEEAPDGFDYVEKRSWERDSHRLSGEEVNGHKGGYYFHEDDCRCGCNRDQYNWSCCGQTVRYCRCTK